MDDLATEYTETPTERERNEAMKDPTNERNDYGGRRMKLHDYQMEAAEGASQRPFEKQKKISKRN